MRIPRPKLNVIELTLLGALVAALGYMAGIYRTASWLQPFVSRGAIELQTLAPKTGPPRNSRGGEEWIVRDYFAGERDGLFVDVGANHYQRDSTYYLETQLGWSGLAIEPQFKFAADYAVHRPLTKFIPLFVSDVSNREAVLYVPLDDVEASSDRSFAEGESHSAVTPMTTNTTTLDDILNQHGVRAIDFLSMDIELHEPQR
jgi:FkbM family methyltransferase